MDSVTQKNGFLSMTGIDQVEENTIAIDENKNALTNVSNAVAGVTNMVNKFVTEEVPYLVKTNGLNQIYNVSGFVPIKRENNWIGGTTTWDAIVFNPPVQNMLGQNVLAGDVGKRYQMTFDVNKGLDVNGPITLKDDSLKIANILGLTQQIADIKKSLSLVTSSTNITDIQTKLSKVETDLNTLDKALKAATNDQKNTQAQVTQINADLDVVESGLDILGKNALQVAFEGVSFIKVGAISGPEIKDGAINGKKLTPEITISTTGAISAAQLTTTGTLSAAQITTTGTIKAANYSVLTEPLLTFQIHGFKNGTLTSGQMVFSPTYYYTNAKKFYWYTLPCNVTITKATFMFNSTANASATMTFDFMVKDSNGSMALPTKSNNIEYFLNKPTMFPTSYTQLVTFVNPVSLSSGILLSVKYSGGPSNEWSVIFHGFQW
jgi:hypothetical protein